MTLKSARKLRGISQESLAYLSGVSASMISLLEASKRMPSFKIAHKLAMALEVKPEEIFPIENNKVIRPSRKIRRVVQVHNHAV